MVLFLIFSGVFITRRNISKKKTVVLITYAVVYLALCVLIVVNKAYTLSSEYSDHLILLLISVNCLDWAFFFWSYLCLYKTFRSIKESDTFKRELYSNMAKSGIMGCLFAIIFIILQIQYIRLII